MSTAIAKLRANVLAKPMGERQRRILGYVRLRDRAGEPFPSEEQIMAALELRCAVVDVTASLLGLEARGLIARTGRTPRGRGWRLSWRLAEAHHEKELVR